MKQPKAFTREKIDALFDDDGSKFVKLRYGDGEIGWAIDMDDKYAVIANIPLEPRLCFKDVVEKGPPSVCKCCPTAGDVVWRYFSRKTGVQYLATDEETSKGSYRRIAKLVRDAGLAIEGCMSGVCVINHHEDTDLVAMFRDAGIDGVTLRTDW